MTWLIFVSKQFPSIGKPLISTNNIHVKRALLEQTPRMKICYPRYPKSIHLACNAFSVQWKQIHN